MTPDQGLTDDAAQARRFCIDLADTVDELIRVLDEETRLVRSARLSDAAGLGPRKASVSERYLSAYGDLRRGAADLARTVPDEVGHLRGRHQALEAAIAQNMAVLATARTVSETLIRGIVDIAGRRQAGPETYDAAGQQTTQVLKPVPLSYNMAL